ncbi:hypothetical protein BCV69DRAFT_213189 [Microstroma glucosiphilum]|uniref:Uncharacterized protein n=1 Tax=Pseudomicrostroma glucosiphilum TaxID=1684307 RepID=A0A316UA67_9BASI|nr:hypothetical protein BCV69DRAFT_213189 [Pseudomicrostroma glucosiphilum]PWN19915.1 hypothetical protein BCV69DRAFT_213189 [Pseudomicrostroma glucosiphilum]
MGGSRSRRKTGALSPHIDWSIKVDPKSSPLPLPQLDDDLRTTARKLYDLQTTVESGKSLARATHWREVDSDATVETRLATILTQEEHKQYIAWRRGRSGPLVLWGASPRRALPCPEKQERRYRTLAWALNAVYPGEYLNADNVAWFQYHQRPAMPLLHAIVKVRQEGLLYLLGRQLWTRPERAELQTARKIIAATSIQLARLNACTLWEKQLVNEIKASLMLIQNREHWTQRKVTAWKLRIEVPFKSAKPSKTSEPRAGIGQRSASLKNSSLRLDADCEEKSVNAFVLSPMSLLEEGIAETSVDGLLDLERGGSLAVQS